MLLFVKIENPLRKYPIQTTGTLTAALTAYITATTPTILFHLNPSTVFVDQSNFTIMNVGGLLLTVPTRQPTGTGNGADTAPAAATIMTAATTAAQAHAALYAAQAVIFASTLPVTFNLNTLPTDVKTRHLHYLDPSYLLTTSDLVPFLTATGGACPSFSHLNPPMGTGVTRQPDLNRVIA